MSTKDDDCSMRRCSISSRRSSTSSTSTTATSTTTTSTSTTTTTNATATASSKRKVHFRISQFSYVEPELIEPPLPISDLFYTKEGLEHIHMENRAIITCLEADSYCLFSDDISSPTRGLEDRTRDGSRRRFWHQQQALRVVMQEQARQRREGIWDPETIAQFYSLLSQGARREARWMGTKDAILAKKVLWDEEETDMDNSRGSDDSLMMIMSPPLSPMVVCSSSPPKHDVALVVVDENHCVGGGAGVTRAGGDGDMCGPEEDASPRRKLVLPGSLFYRYHDDRQFQSTTTTNNK